MKFITLICITIISNFIFAQKVTDTTKFRDSSNYHLAIKYYYTKIISEPDNYYNYYQIACFYSLINNFDSAFISLDSSINKGAKGENVLTDTDFNILRQDSLGWERIDKLLRKQYLDKNPHISRPDLGYELWKMWVEDQRYRTLWSNNKLDSLPKQTIDSQHQREIRLKKIIHKIGWPKYSEVGIEGGDAAFYIFQHSNLKDMKKVLPMFIRAGKENEADLGKAAMMIDRVLTITDKVQIYGSQAHSINSVEGKKYENIKFELYPIADEEHMLKRRENLGMADFYQNCKRLNVVFIPIKDRKDYIYIPITKKWKRKGYLLID